MPFHGSLTTPQLARLRGPDGRPRYWSSQYMSVCPNDVVYKTTVATTSLGNVGFATVALGSTISGSPSDVAVGMLVLSGHDDDITRATWRGRVRGTISLGVLPINETSANLVSGDYLWVVEDYPVVEKYAREDGAGGYFKDYAETYKRMPPLCSGLQHAYAGFVDSTGVMRIPFSITPYATESGGSTPTVLWSFPAGSSIVSGGTNQAAVTVDFHATDGDWCSLTLTEGGRSWVYHFIVFAHHPDLFPPFMDFASSQIDCSVETGWSGSVEVFDWDPSVLDNSLVCLWDVEFYADEEGPLVPGHEVRLVGRVKTSGDSTGSDRQYGLVSSRRLTIEGLGPQLSRIVAPLIAMRHAAAPTAWDEIKDLTPWREVVHVLAEHSTALNSAGIEFDSTASTYLEMKVATQGGSLQSSCATQAEGINAVLMYSPQGELRMARDARYLSTAARDALTTVAAWDSRDWLDISLEVSHVQFYGRCSGNGATFFPTGNMVYPYLAMAPGVAFDGGGSEGSLQNQILEANQSPGLAKYELGDRVGDHWAVLNATTSLTVTHPDGYHFLIPRVDQWHTFSIAASDTTGGMAFTESDRWLLTSISITHDNTRGSKQVRATYDLETDGPRGVAYEPPAGASEEDYLPTFPGFDPYDGLGGDFYWVDPNAGLEDVPPISEDPNMTGKIISDGNLVVVTDGSSVFRTTKFISGGANPPWEDLTPPSSNVITAIALDHTRADGKVGLYVLGNDGTDSYLDYLADVMGNAVDYARGGSVVGVYHSVRVYDTSGQVGIYAPEAEGAPQYEAGTHTVNFDGTGYESYTINLGHEGAGGYSGEGLNSDVYSGSDVGVDIDVEFANDKTITAYSHLQYSGFNNAFVRTNVKFYDSSDTLITSKQTDRAVQIGWQTHQIGGLPIGGVRRMNVSTYSNWVGVIYDNITFTMSEDDPPSSGATVQYSADYGVTFVVKSLISPGDVGGFDVARVGDVTLAAGNAQTYKAIAKGGALSSVGTDGATSGADPVLLMYPWYLRNSTAAKNFSTSTPDYVMGSSALVSGECLWWVAGSGGRTNITPPGATAAAGPDCTTTYYGTRIAAIMLVSGTPTLFTSSNGGTSWLNRGSLASGSKYVRFRRVGGSGNQVYASDGANIRYSGNAHAAAPSWVTKTGPSGIAIVALEPWG